LETFALLKKYAANGDGFVRMTEEDLNRLRNVLVEMLADFHRLCEDNHLTYLLTGGSALGAQRDGQIIPWDDDIDVLMPRADYEKLAELVEQTYPEKYWVQNLHTCDRFDLNFAKLRKYGTAYVELYEPAPDKAGICIDVYPLDAAPDNRLARVFHGLVDEALYLAASCVRMHQKKDRLLTYIKDERLSGIIRFKCFLGKLLLSRKDPRSWYLRCEKWAGRLRRHNTGYLAVSSGRKHYFGEMYKRERILPPRPIAFAGGMYYAAKDNDYLLRILYGDDYMTPHKEGQKESHALLALSFETKRSSTNE